MPESLYWDSSYALGLRLRQAHPDVELETVTLQMIQDWVLALPEFADDPALVNDGLLTEIYNEWLELGFA